MLCAGCPNELTGRQKRWCSPDCSKEAARTARLATVFNITPAEYDAILAEQGGVCGICGKPPKPGRRLATDHDHRTGYVRGLLCYLDNRVIVGARTPEKLVAAAAYVTDPPARAVIGDRVAPGRPKSKRKIRRRRRGGKNIS